MSVKYSLLEQQSQNGMTRGFGWEGFASGLLGILSGADARACSGRTLLSITSRAFSVPYLSFIVVGSRDSGFDGAVEASKFETHWPVWFIGLCKLHGSCGFHAVTVLMAN